MILDERVVFVVVRTTGASVAAGLVDVVEIALGNVEKTVIVVALVTIALGVCETELASSLLPVVNGVDAVAAVLIEPTRDGLAVKRCWL